VPPSGALVRMTDDSMTDDTDGTTHASANDERPKGSGPSGSGFPWLTRRSALALGGTVLGATAMGSGTVLAQADDEPTDGGADGGTYRYRVTVTNLTRGQPFTPPAVALHEPSVGVFSVGEPANEAVQQLAENGNLDPLVALIEETDEIRAAAVGEDPLVPSDDPGETGYPYYETLEIEADERATHLTFLSMLVATNDGFAGLDTVALPTEEGASWTLHADGYDAGTEQNTERFDDLVPPAQTLILGGEAEGGTTESDPDIAEDEVVRPHPGIAGDGDLSPDDYGWDEPAAAVHVERIGGDE